MGDPGWSASQAFRSRSVPSIELAGGGTPSFGRRRDSGLRSSTARGFPASTSLRIARNGPAPASLSGAELVHA